MQGLNIEVGGKNRNGGTAPLRPSLQPLPVNCMAQATVWLKYAKTKYRTHRTAQTTDNNTEQACANPPNFVGIEGLRDRVGAIASKC